ncbi:DsbA family protein [Streptomyces sp. NPDC102340]|uniref:DsbA family oxidoreductase n=1 Tax=unclassified Streptomyces TaxID=2593676 RepID=UPI003824543B
MTGDPVAPRLEVVEYTDPLCPWSWGSEATFRSLRQALEGRVRWRRVYCILFDDDDDPAPDAAAETAWYARYIEEVGAHTRAPYAARLSRVAASSWPASLVAKAAEAQGEEVSARALRRLRETVFVLGEPADTLDLALSAARDVPGLDPDRLRRDATSEAVRERVLADHAEARRPVAEVLAPLPGDSPHPGAAKETDDGAGLRYALPTVLVRGEAGHRVVPGWRPYDEYVAAVEELSPGLTNLTKPVRPLPADEALRRHRTLTEPERSALACGPWPPPDAVRADIANGPLWLCPSEADVHPATRPHDNSGPLAPR